MHVYDGEIEESEKASLLNMSKYFQVYNFPSNLKSRLATYQLNCKESLWREETKIVYKIQGKNLTWKLFMKHCKQKLLNERYYNEKERVFNKLKLKQ